MSDKPINRTPTPKPGAQNPQRDDAEGGESGLTRIGDACYSSEPPLGTSHPLNAARAPAGEENAGFGPGVTQAMAESVSAEIGRVLAVFPSALGRAQAMIGMAAAQLLPLPPEAAWGLVVGLFNMLEEVIGPMPDEILELLAGESEESDDDRVH